MAISKKARDKVKIIFKIFFIRAQRVFRSLFIIIREIAGLAAHIFGQISLDIFPPSFFIDRGGGEGYHELITMNQ